MRLSIRFLLFGVILSAATIGGPASLRAASENGSQGREPSIVSSPSDFVRAQATSKVQWHPWDEASLAAAKASGKSVYVFIGSPLSELTRATVNQTFTSEKTIAWLNENFFCLFVDGDAQPEVAALGQHFITTVKQLKGWPIHLWLTPDTLQPYDGANYLPPSEEWGKPGFLKAARAALDTWQAGPDRAHALASEALEMMKLPPLDLKARLDIPAKLVAATKAWVAAADSVNGGFGSAPKQPEPELIRFLLTRDKAAQEVAIKAARALVSGALRDPVDGGFYRRCIDEAWKEPYFQKTLVDQARIALALFEAADAAKDEKLRAAGIGALEFVLKELRNPDGTFAAALDGTLEENADPAKRPKFAKVGSATSAALGLFFSACRLSGAKHLVEAASGLAGRLPGGNPRNFTLAHAFRSGSPPTAADYLGAVLAVRVAAEGELLKGVMGDMLALAKDLYFDAATGTYMASRSQLAPGIAARVPAPADALSAEVLALLAAVDAKTADLIRRNLMNQIEYDELPPGDILLGLSQGQK